MCLYKITFVTLCLSRPHQSLYTHRSQHNSHPPKPLHCSWDLCHQQGFSMQPGPEPASSRCPQVWSSHMAPVSTAQFHMSHGQSLFLFSWGVSFETVLLCLVRCIACPIYLPPPPQAESQPVGNTTQFTLQVSAQQTCPSKSNHSMQWTRSNVCLCNATSSSTSKPTTSITQHSFPVCQSSVDCDYKMSVQEHWCV